MVNIITAVAAAAAGIAGDSAVVRRSAASKFITVPKPGRGPTQMDVAKQKACEKEHHSNAGLDTETVSLAF